MTLLLISFFAGALTVLAPCVLPILPVIIGKSVTGSNRNTPLIVTLSLGASVFLFTLLLKASTAFIDIPQDFWKYLSGGILITFGIFTLFENVWVSIVQRFKFQEKANTQFSVGYKKKSIWGDVIMGGALGPVFATCSPTYFLILATVLPVSYLQGILYILSYVLGLSLVLFGIAYIGQRFVSKLEILANPKGWFKRSIATLFILIGLAIVTGFDKKIETAVLDAGFFDITKVEQKILEKIITPKQTILNTTQEINSQKDPLTIIPNSLPEKIFAIMPNISNIENVLYKDPIPAPNTSSPDAFINTDGKNINISDYRGKKVVLVNFWTYSCINCKRTVPHLNALYAKYRESNFEIISIHTPEFAFEKVIKNVEKAVSELGIKYPVIIDNDFSTWRSYENQYWPRVYIVDRDGNIVYDHAGEGAYEEIDRVVGHLLSL